MHTGTHLHLCTLTTTDDHAHLHLRTLTTTDLRTPSLAHTDDHGRPLTRRCNTLIRIHGRDKHVNQIVPLFERFCDACGPSTRLMRFEFSPPKTALGSVAGAEEIQGRTKEGCLVCDDELAAMTETIEGNRVHVKVKRQQRAHRSGRGGRRGGRGGKRNKDSRESLSSW